VGAALHSGDKDQDGDDDEDCEESQVGEAEAFCARVEAVGLCCEGVRTVLGVRGLLPKVTHQAVASYLGVCAAAACQAATSAARRLRPALLSSSSSPSSSGSAVLCQAALSASWSVERCVLVGVSRLLRTHSRLVYSCAPLLTQLHLALLRAVSVAVEVAAEASSASSSSSSSSFLSASSSSLPSSAAPAWSALESLAIQVARCAARLLMEVSEGGSSSSGGSSGGGRGGKSGGGGASRGGSSRGGRGGESGHSLALKKHLPSVLLDYVLCLEKPSWSNLGGSTGSGNSAVARRVRKVLQPGLMALVGCLGPRELSQVASLLPGGAQGAPRALLKQLLEEHHKHYKFTGGGV